MWGMFRDELDDLLARYHMRTGEARSANTRIVSIYMTDREKPYTVLVFQVSEAEILDLGAQAEHYATEPQRETMSVMVEQMEHDATKQADNS